jgi:diacylglycerol kinase (ATP)
VTVHRVLVVLNEAARGGAAVVAGEVVSRCEGLGVQVVRLAPHGEQQAVAGIAEVLRDPGGCSAVVAVGGDGTVRTCAEALAGGDVPMAIVPAGTGNSLYRALWEDRPWQEVVPEVLSDVRTGGARVRDLDLLAVRGLDSGAEAVAMLGATAGLIAEVVRASEGLTGVSGRERYAAATGPALEAHEPFPARVVLDGELLVEGPASLVAVGGARHRSGTFQLLPRSVLDDGLLDVCVIGGIGAAGFVELAGAVVAGEHLAHPEVAYGQGRSVRIERTDGEPLVFEHDGDLWPAEDRAVEVVVDGSVKVLAPADPVAG